MEFAQNLLSEGFICHIYFSAIFRDAADFVVFLRVRRTKGSHDLTIYLRPQSSLSLHDGYGK